MRSYGQYCPIARASEILAERWTPLVVRNLMFGADTFSQIARGVPVDVALDARHPPRASSSGRASSSAPRRTPAAGSRYAPDRGRPRPRRRPRRAGRLGRALGRRRPGAHRSRVRAVGVVPGRSSTGAAARHPDRVVVAFDFLDQPPGNRHYWLLVEHGDAQVCYSDPGDEPAVHVRAESAAAGRLAPRRRCPGPRALRTGRIVVTGDRRLAAALPRWNLREPQLTA